MLKCEQTYLKMLKCGQRCLEMLHKKGSRNAKMVTKVFKCGQKLSKVMKIPIAKEENACEIKPVKAEIVSRLLV